jgi:hypothetical protein
LNIDTTDKTDEEKRAKKKKAYQHFSQYRGILPEDFDYKKELSDYRNERYGHID